ncbi:YbjQ family protein [Schaalia sp. 19OD2882]|uniref:YbjQ family protein n=1 Tax=Schaalia sp. 19OD2882 TaxID=2794089 RepID=UPI001C1F1740|nr:YbjQ family protein [Schaalia sp. 19OD2882]QWW19559.1 YbjQ family protein [Schaalia sp. 19OD2882]
MLVVTTNAIEGHPVQQYVGMVSGETIAGVNLFKDIGAGFRNLVGGRSSAYESEMQQAAQTAVNEMCGRAQQMGANAIIAVKVDYFTLGADNGMLAACATGTAVII